MKTLLPLAALSATCLALGACQTMAQRIGEKEDLLAAAGFAMQPANTPQRQASLAQLPPNKFVPRTMANGETEYVYADTAVCDCLYVGDQKAYGAYKQDVFAKKIVDEQQMTALTYQDAWNWDRWDWGPWGRSWRR